MGLISSTIQWLQARAKGGSGTAPSDRSAPEDRGTSLGYRDQDVFIVSYPRSGNTWMRFLLANVTDPDQPADFVNIRQRAPSTYYRDEASKALESSSGRCFIKSHEPYDPSYPRVLYLVRDPRSVAISYFHFLCLAGKIDRDVGLEPFVEQSFLTGAVEFGRWSDHVKSWLDALEGSGKLWVVRYEDLRLDPIQTLTGIRDFLREDWPTDRLARAVEHADFRRMQALEEEAPESHRPGAPQFAETNERFVRKGSLDEWREELSPALQRRIEDEFGETMARLGYPMGNR